MDALGKFGEHSTLTLLTCSPNAKACEPTANQTKAHSKTIAYKKVASHENVHGKYPLQFYNCLLACYAIGNPYEVYGEIATIIYMLARLRTR